MDQVTILTALSDVFTIVWNVSIDGQKTEVHGYFTDDISINQDGSYKRHMTNAKIKHPNYSDLYELDICSPVGDDGVLLFEQVLVENKNQ